MSISQHFLIDVQQRLSAILTIIELNLSDEERYCKILASKSFRTFISETREKSDELEAIVYPKGDRRWKQDS